MTVFIPSLIFLLIISSPIWIVILKDFYFHVKEKWKEIRLVDRFNGKQKSPKNFFDWKPVTITKEGSLTMFFKYYKRRAELEAKLSTLQLELNNKSSEANMKLKEKEHELGLKIQTMTEELSRARKLAKEEHDIKLQEILSLTKLESEQKIAKVQLDHQQLSVTQKTDFDRQIADLQNANVAALAALRTANAEALAKMQQNESVKYHDMMNKALTELNEKGTVGSRQLHELSMKVLDTARPGIHESRYLTGSINGSNTKDADVVVVAGAN